MHALTVNEESEDAASPGLPVYLVFGKHLCRTKSLDIAITSIAAV